MAKNIYDPNKRESKQRGMNIIQTSILVIFISDMSALIMNFYSFEITVIILLSLILTRILSVEINNDL